MASTTASLGCGSSPTGTISGGAQRARRTPILGRCPFRWASPLVLFVADEEATDLTILVIAVVTLVGITRTTLMPEPTQLAKWILCSSIWVLPIITGTHPLWIPHPPDMPASIAAGKHFFVPVNGNWCWIKEDPKYLRYALTHTWRFLTIVSCVFIYSFIYWYLSKNFRGLRNATTHHSSLDNGTYLAEQSTYRSAHGEHSQQAIVDPYRQVELRKSMGESGLVRGLDAR